MLQAGLDIFHVDGSGSPASTKISVSFHGYGWLVVIEAPEIAPDEGYPSLIG